MAAGYQPVARVAKPHGLKGEVVVYLLTDRPEEVLLPGRRFALLDGADRPTGATVEVERARPYHRRWLVKLRGVDDRTSLEAWRGHALGVAPDALPVPDDGGLRAHEVPGASVLVAGARIGTATGLIPVPGGALLEVDVAGRAVLVPYRPPILVAVRREAREIVIDPPPGLLEL